MLRRVSAGLILTLILTLFLGVQQSRAPMELRLSRLMAGEYWHTITLEERRVGYLFTEARVLPDGSWQYSTHTHVLMQAGETLNIHKVLRFAGSAPYQLLSGEQTTRRGTGKAVVVRISESGGSLHVDTPEGGQQSPLARTITLADYLGVETWLLGRPPDGARLRAPTLLFDPPTIRRQTWTLASTDATGWTLTTEAPTGTTTSHINHHMVADTIDMAGLFDFAVSSREEALAIASPAFKSSYLLPVVDRLEATADIASMRLTVLDTASGEVLARLDAHRQQVSDAAPPRTMNPAVDPASVDASLSQLVHDWTALRGLPPHRRADRLLTVVRDALRYQEGAAPETLDRVIARGYGECTEFADLFTALATAAGLPSRTVIGLAYQARQPWGFAFHAWVETWVDDHWEVIDPTWGQRFADVTHLPLDQRVLTSLRMYSSQQTAIARVGRIVRDSVAGPP
ncbi:MAG: transglutaminase domain-containing protein [Pseudomonadales bacterium]|nr:transglutaminase domain-containing protein [Pseudomonadales bacterium]MCP5182938.1 transglutaminase domain-containing protein [Pseudomonadales bacterium]